jgi:hypothetical protein
MCKIRLIRLIKIISPQSGERLLIMRIMHIPVPPQRRPKQIDSNPLKSKKKSRLILNAILTSIFYSISENFNSIFLGGFEVEQVYTERDSKIGFGKAGA